MAVNIEKLFIKKVLCEIYEYNGEGKNFHVGYIVAQDKNFIIIKSVTCYGKNDGFQCIRINNIMKIRYETRYLKNIEKIMVENYNNSKNIEFIKEDIFVKFAENINSNNILCNIITEYDSCYGYIDKLFNEEIILKQYNDNGDSDGYCILPIDDVICVSIGSEDEIKFEQLINN